MTSPLITTAGPPITLSGLPAQVDEVTVRLIAAVVVLVGVLALVTQQWWLYLVLFADFSVRAAVGPRWSPIARAVSGWLRPRVAVAKRPTAFAPKRFAAGIGAIMSAAIAALWIVHAVTGATTVLTAATLLALVMIVLPALEAALGFCLGCTLFVALMRVGLIPRDVCIDCAPPVSAT